MRDKADRQRKSGERRVGKRPTSKKQGPGLERPHPAGPHSAAFPGASLGHARLNGTVYHVTVGQDRLHVGEQYSIPFTDIRDVRVADANYETRTTPTWAVVLAILGAFFFLLGLLFLLVKETRINRRATVTVYTGQTAYPFILEGRTAQEAYDQWYPLIAAGRQMPRDR